MGGYRPGLLWLRRYPLPFLWAFLSTAAAAFGAAGSPIFPASFRMLWDFLPESLPTLLLLLFGGRKLFMPEIINRKLKKAIYEDRYDGYSPRSQNNAINSV
jgi:hypothetical protein